MSSASSPPAVAARHADGSFEGQDGARIFWQSWEPETGDARAVVVIAHGAAEHGGRYRYVVERLVPDGLAVYAIDHRGHGRSSGRRAQIDRMAHVVADLDVLVDQARAAHPQVRLFLLGHSMGGSVALAYALAHQDRLDGLILSAPLALIEAAPRPVQLAARVLSAVAPNLGVYQVKATAVSRDPEEVRAYRDDPLVYTGKLPARTIQELAQTTAAFPGALPRLTLPLLVMSGTEDGLIPPAASTLVHDTVTSGDKRIERYEGFYHELFNEPAGQRDVPLGDLAAWLAARA